MDTRPHVVVCIACAADVYFWFDPWPVPAGAPTKLFCSDGIYQGVDIWTSVEEASGLVQVGTAVCNVTWTVPEGYIEFRVAGESHSLGSFQFHPANFSVSETSVGTLRRGSQREVEIDCSWAGGDLHAEFVDLNGPPLPVIPPLPSMSSCPVTLNLTLPMDMVVGHTYYLHVAFVNAPTIHAQWGPLHISDRSGNDPTDKRPDEEPGNSVQPAPSPSTPSPETPSTDSQNATTSTDNSIKNSSGIALWMWFCIGLGAAVVTYVLVGALTEGILNLCRRRGSRNPTLTAKPSGRHSCVGHRVQGMDDSHVARGTQRTRGLVRIIKFEDDRWVKARAPQKTSHGADD